MRLSEKARVLLYSAVMLVWMAGFTALVGFSIWMIIVSSELVYLLLLVVFGCVAVLLGDYVNDRLAKWAGLFE